MQFVAAPAVQFSRGPGQVERLAGLEGRAPNGRGGCFWELKGRPVKAHWGLLIRAGLKTCENRSFRVPPGFYLVHASISLSFFEGGSGDWD